MTEHYYIWGHEIEKKTMHMIIEFALLVAVMMLAYNVGQYDSLQYQAMFKQCENCEEYCNKPIMNITEPININKLPIENNDHG